MGQKNKKVLVGVMNMENKQNSTYSWIVLIIVLLAATAAPLAMFKVPTVMSNICEEFGINATQGGLVFSIFSLVPIFLAIPVGIIVAKYGNWKLGLVALACLIGGSVIGICSTSLTPLLISRVIEGVAMTLLATIGPNIVNQLFEPEQRGKAMGLFLCYIALGQTVMYNASPYIVNMFGGWRSVWWFTVIYSVVFILLWFFVLKKADKPEAVALKTKSEKMPMGSVLKNMDVWIITIVFILFMIGLQGALNFLSTFFAEVKGMDSGQATQIVGLQGIVGCVALVLSGIISDKLNSRKWMTIVLLIICGGVYASIPFFPISAAVLVVLLLGFFSNMVPSVVFAAIPVVKTDSRSIGLAIRVLTTGQFIGIFLSTILFGMFVDNIGWTSAYIFAGATAILGALLMLGVKKLKR